VHACWLWARKNQGNPLRAKARAYSRATHATGSASHIGQPRRNAARSAAAAASQYPPRYTTSNP